MANQAVELLKNTDNTIWYRDLQRKATEWFNMDSYIKEIDKLGLNSKKIVNKTLDVGHLNALKDRQLMIMSLEIDRIYQIFTGMETSDLASKAGN